jgi:hypothetical protein
MERGDYARRLEDELESVQKEVGSSRGPLDATSALSGSTRNGNNLYKSFMSNFYKAGERRDSLKPGTSQRLDRAQEYLRSD